MSSNSSITYCFESRTTVFIFTAVLVTNVLLLAPLLTLVACLGARRRRSAAATSHSDFFTYNMAALELISIVSSCFYCFGGQHLQAVGNSVFYLTSSGQTLIHLLTCLERYLAVVHPVTYLRLKQAGGLRVRNVTTGCVWLLSSALMALSVVSRSFVTFTTSSIMVSSLVLVSVFSFSVLRVLDDPGPGVSRDRRRAHRSKQKAFHTIVAIMVTELFRLVGVLVYALSSEFLVLNEVMCTLASAFIWLAVPCGLVLPLLFLQRAGKLPGSKDRTNSG